MTYREFIHNNFNVLAETDNAIFFEANGEKCCKINGANFACNSVEEFFNLVEFFGDDTMEV